jgi:hypothetical protein
MEYLTTQERILIELKKQNALLEEQLGPQREHLARKKAFQEENAKRMYNRPIKAEIEKLRESISLSIRISEDYKNNPPQFNFPITYDGSRCIADIKESEKFYEQQKKNQEERIVNIELMKHKVKELTETLR